MITLTKEWLLKTIAELEEERDAVPGVVNEDAVMALAAMKLALASLEAKPVAEVCEGFALRYIGHGPANKSGVHIGDRLYTAPPAQMSVPAAIHSQGEKSVGDDYYALGWNACRAAMLQGAEPVQEWIPCSERMPEVEGHYLVWANASKLEGYCNHQDIAAYQAGQWSNEFGWLVTHWMPLLAAPQQE